MVRALTLALALAATDGFVPGAKQSMRVARTPMRLEVMGCTKGVVRKL